MNIAIIPARAGSKRLKNKNLKTINGKPLIYYAINTAIKSKLFDDVVISTDSPKILNKAKKFGANNNGLRLKKLCLITPVTTKNIRIELKLGCKTILCFN